MTDEFENKIPKESTNIERVVGAGYPAPLTNTKYKYCVQCGEKCSVDSFRTRYYRPKNKPAKVSTTYNICKTCERINSREKYLRGKTVLLDSDEKELRDIHILWDVQRKNGLKPPQTLVDNGTVSIHDYVKDQLALYLSGKVPDVKMDLNLQASSNKIELPESSSDYVPADLQIWLTKELTEHPDYYTDEVYENLCSTFSVYKGTNEELFNEILSRFYAYEEEYFAENGDF